MVAVVDQAQKCHKNQVRVLNVPGQADHQK
jgi:hypothetical protein